MKVSSNWSFSSLIENSSISSNCSSSSSFSLSLSFFLSPWWVFNFFVNRLVLFFLSERIGTASPLFGYKYSNFSKKCNFLNAKLFLKIKTNKASPFSILVWGFKSSSIDSVLLTLFPSYNFEYFSFCLLICSSKIFIWYSLFFFCELIKSKYSFCLCFKSSNFFFFDLTFLKFFSSIFFWKLFLIFFSSTFLSFSSWSTLASFLLKVLLFTLFKLWIWFDDACLE